MRTLALICILALSACAGPLAQRPASAPAATVSQKSPLERAVEAIEAGDASTAEQLLAGIDTEALSPADRLLHQTLSADAALLQANPLRALQLLPPPYQTGNRRLAAYIEAVRGRTLFALDDAVGAVRALVAREQLLDSPDALRKNRDLIWTGLQDAAIDPNTLSHLGDADPVTRGWIELALIDRSVWMDPQARTAQIEDWTLRHPEHPAQAILDRLGERERAMAGALNTIALLLPLDGGFGSASASIRDGLLSAWYADPQQRPRIRIYNTGDSIESLLTAVQRATDDGADFMIGPLRKEHVAALAARDAQPVPVLALNYLDGEQAAPFNFFQWGLAPEDEARQAADRATSEGQRYAVALVPNTARGDRVLAAYAERLAALGGEVLEVARYEPDTRDYQAPIRALLNLDDSRQRHASLRAMIGGDVHFEPRRRTDVDHVFIAARADQARQIKPTLKFLRAGDLPVYATALVYDGGDARHPELDGLRFCDMPWMIGQDPRWREQRAQLAALFGEREASLPRLFALGHDAYLLMRLIHSGQLQVGMYLPAASGNLSLQPGGRVARALVCAEFRDGRPELLDIALPVDVPPGDAREPALDAGGDG